MKPEQLKKQFDKCKTSENQMIWLINAGVNEFGVGVILDNDCTWVDFGEDDDGESLTSNLHESLGNMSGVVTMLDAMGLNADLC